jgi:hypothetical protein
MIAGALQAEERPLTTGAGCSVRNSALVVIKIGEREYAREP